MTGGKDGITPEASACLPTFGQTGEASFKEGIIEIRVPKAEEAKKKEWKIPIE